jgi:hypothetical protein
MSDPSSPSEVPVRVRHFLGWLIGLTFVFALIELDEPRALRPLMAVGWATSVAVSCISEWLVRDRTAMQGGWRACPRMRPNARGY